MNKKKYNKEIKDSENRIDSGEFTSQNNADVLLEQFDNIESSLDTEPLDIFVNRLKKINIEVEVWCNYPWIYLYKVNGNRVEEKYDSEHAFKMAYLPVRVDRQFTFTNIKKIFEIIKKYK